MAFDPDEFLQNYGKAPAPKKKAAFDPDAFLASYGNEEKAAPSPAPSPVASEPSRPKKTQAQIDFEIQRGMLPEPTALDAAKAALDPREMYLDAEAGASRAFDAASFGVVPYLDEKLAGIPREQQRAFVESRQGTEFGGNIAGMGLAGATNVAAPFATAGKNLVSSGVEAVKKVSPKVAEAVGRWMPTVVKPITEAAVGSGIAGATDATIRGGSPEEIAKAAGVSALVGGGMSALPVAAQGVESLAHKAVLNRAVKPITDVAKGKVDKALSQFGGGKSIEEGEANLKAFVDKENLQPILRNRGAKMEEQFDARKWQVWDEELSPIYKKAYEVEPNASVPTKAIKDKLKSLVSDDQRGTSRSDLVNKYIEQIDNIATKEEFGNNFPVRNLLNKARDLQGKGHSGVVNYDSPTENKELEREVGRALRELANERIGKIFAKNPKAAAELLGREPATTKKPRSITEGLENEDVKAIGEQFRQGNKRFSDYSKLDPLVDQAAKNQARDRQPFDVRDRLKQGGATSIGALVGGGIGGLPGAAVGGATGLAISKAAPLAERASEFVASKLAGGPANPLDLVSQIGKRPLTKTEIASIMATPVGMEAIRGYINSKRKKR